MTTTFCRDPECGRPLDSEAWLPWCGLEHAHRWLWRARTDCVDAEQPSAAPATAREAG